MAHGAVAQCRPDQAFIQSDNGLMRFSIELAATPADRDKGLMFREALPLGSGMLFVYERPQLVAFWMRNTLIPLDMIFIDPVGEIAKVHENAIPLDETPIFGDHPDIQYVLEINGGLAARLGIKAGDILQHPAIDQTIAAFPCED